MQQPELLPLGAHLAVLHRMFRRYFTSHMEPLGLPGRSATILFELSLHPGTSQDTLASTLALEKTQIAKLCKYLEQRGLIRRDTNPADRREYQLFLTSAGEALAPAVADCYRQWNDSLSAGLTQAEQLRLGELLRLAEEAARRCLTKP